MLPFGALRQKSGSGTELSTDITDVPQRSTLNTHHTTLLERWHYLKAFLCPKFCFCEHAHPDGSHRDAMSFLMISVPSGVRCFLAGYNTGAANVHTPVEKLVLCQMRSVLSAAPDVCSSVAGALPSLWPALRALRTRSLRITLPCKLSSFAQESFTPDLCAAFDFFCKIASRGYTRACCGFRKWMWRHRRMRHAIGPQASEGSTRSSLRRSETCRVTCSGLSGCARYGSRVYRKGTR